MRKRAQSPDLGRHSDLWLLSKHMKEPDGCLRSFGNPDHHPTRAPLVLTAQLHPGRREASACAGASAASAAAAAGSTPGARGPDAPTHGPDRCLSAAGAAWAGGRASGAAAAASASAAWLRERAGPRPARAPRAASRRPAAAHGAEHRPRPRGSGSPGCPSRRRCRRLPRVLASSRPRRSGLGSGSGPAPAAGHAGRCSPAVVRAAVAALGPHREPRGTPGNEVHKSLRVDRGNDGSRCTSGNGVQGTLSADGTTGSPEVLREAESLMHAGKQSPLTQFIGCVCVPEPGALWEIESVRLNLRISGREASREMESSPRPHRIAGVKRFLKHAGKWSPRWFLKSQVDTAIPEMGEEME